MMTKGTPKTIEQAIANGLEAAKLSPESEVAVIKSHIVDYLSHEFNVSMLEHPMASVVIEQLFIRIKKGL